MNDVTIRLLVDAIIGKGFPSMEDAMRYERLKLSYFSGNQHNEAWEWHRTKLMAMSADDLLSIYNRKR